MTKHERALLKEIIYYIEQLDRQMRLGAGAGLQEVSGEMRECCVMCGHCPSAMAEKLKELTQ
jgi:hypothetical protein